MERKIISLITALIMAVTVFSLPMTSVAYGTDVTEETDVVVVDEQNNEENTLGVQASALDAVDISGASVGVETAAYTGAATTPAVSVAYGGTVLVKDQDYTVTYGGDTLNVGTEKAYVTVTGINGYTGNKTVYYSIMPADINNAVFAMETTNYAYNDGKDVTPEFTVKYNNIELVKGKDYNVTYTNNIYPGTAKMTVTGINNFTSSFEKTYSIAKIKNLKVKDTGTKYITLSWSKQPNVTGYKVYKYNFSKEIWSVYKTIETNGTTTCKVSGLNPGLGYKFNVKAYVAEGDTNYLSEDSTIISAPTKPNQASIKSITDSVKLQMTVKWYKRTGTGYQVRISRSSKFSSYNTYKVTSSKTLTKKISKLRDDSTYYVKVRAYKTYDGKTVYGAWSKVKKIHTDGTGWVTLNGKRYYYKAGTPLKGTHKVGGNRYYFNTSTGVMQGVSSTMWSKVKNTSSGSNWLVAVSRDYNRVCVYQGSTGNWVLKKYYLCTTGAASTRSPKGYFTMPTERPRKPSFGDGYTCWYATRIVGNVYFHSIVYNPLSKSSVQDGRLGGNYSHGCIRLSLTNAKWIYNNIPPKTKVIIY